MALYKSSIRIFKLPMSAYECANRKLVISEKNVESTPSRLLHSESTGVNSDTGMGRVPLPSPKFALLTTILGGMRKLHRKLPQRCPGLKFWCI